jgi:hypothetical protein
MVSSMNEDVLRPTSCTDGSSPAPTSALTYRKCDYRDLPVLQNMRRACGWGIERVSLASSPCQVRKSVANEPCRDLQAEKYLSDPDCITYIFSHGGRDVAMGCLILESADPMEASRKDGIVMICKSTKAPNLTVHVPALT